MPKLTFDEVFAEPGEEEDKIEELEEMRSTLTLFIVQLMVERGLKTIILNRTEFTKLMELNHIPEPLLMSFERKGETLKASIVY